MNKYYIPQFHIYDNDAEKSIFVQCSKVDSKRTGTEQILPDTGLSGYG